MIAFALLSCGADPSFVVGGTVAQLGGGSRSGKSDYFVAEACEYDRSFHNLPPKVAIITNIEEDHLDCYKDIADIIDSFHTFARKVPRDGKIIALASDSNITTTLKGIETQIDLCDFSGTENANWTVQPTDPKNGCPTGTILYKGKHVATIQLSIPGAHNLMNALMAVAACVECDADPQKAADAIGQFKGVDRRMTEIGRINGALVIDDYGHHPTEIRATLKALRERYQPARLFCVFQPHQHSRTRFLLKDFASSFENATEAIIPDIYFVRDSETEKTLVNAEDLVARIIENGHQARHMPEFETIVSYLRSQARRGDLIVTMGAGNVWEIGRDVVENRMTKSE
jgi:UDP-N-acetylmuramate--alanine ligase